MPGVNDDEEIAGMNLNKAQEILKKLTELQNEISQFELKPSGSRSGRPGLFRPDPLPQHLNTIKASINTVSQFFEDINNPEQALNNFNERQRQAAALDQEDDAPAAQELVRGKDDEKIIETMRQILFVGSIEPGNLARLPDNLGELVSKAMINPPMPEESIQKINSIVEDIRALDPGQNLRPMSDALKSRLQEYTKNPEQFNQEHSRSSLSEDQSSSEEKSLRFK